MSDKKLEDEITDEYSHEILDIRNKLNQLENGRIYELSGAKMDGYLATNISELRELIIDLLYKIQSGEEGTATRLGNIMRGLNE